MVSNIGKVLKFLSKYRTRKEIEKKFKMSNTESYHLIRWLLKAKMIEEVSIPGKTNRVWYYKAKKGK